MTVPHPDRRFLLSVLLAAVLAGLCAGGALAASGGIEVPVTVSATGCSGLPSALQTDCTKAYAECAAAPAADRSLCTTELNTAIAGLRKAYTECGTVPAADRSICEEAVQKELSALKTTT